MFSKYFKVFDIGLQNTFVYRWNFLLRSLFALIPLAGTLYIWGAVFDERGKDIAGYDHSSMILYFLLVVVVDNLVAPTEDEWQIAADIRDGQINSFLTKPMNYLAYRFSLFASYRILYSVVTLPVVLIVFVLLRDHISLPQNWITWPLAMLSLAMAGALQFFIAYSLAMLAFWILEISTIVFILYSFEYFLSGHVFPLDIMPVWFQRVLEYLPFKYELYFPVAVFMENIRGEELVRGFILQAVWTAILYGIALFMWSRGIRKYQAVGG